MSSQTSLSAAATPAVVAIDENSSGDDSVSINSPNRWFFDKEKLESTPSRKCGIDSDKELTYRQQSANFIQDIGQRLQVNQLCINTAIVYMHRFYMFHSFSHFHRNAVSTASIFLAAKVEEQPRKLEHVIKVAHYCLHRDTQPQIDIKSEQYLEQSSELVMNENVLLQTLGFDVAIDHPHTHVVKCCQLVRASKDLAQTSYFMATNSLHLTTMCLQYKPTVVACVCIHLACKWSNWEIPRSKEGKDWFWYVDDTVTTEQLETMTTEFLTIFNKSPSRLKKKMMSLNQVSGAANLSLSSFPTHLGLDPTSPGAPNFPKSRSPSPAGSSKRPTPMKPAGSQQILPSKSAKPHSSMPHHGMKPHSAHHGPPPASGTTKHVHPSAGKPSYHVSHPHGFSLHSAKDAHQQQAPQPMKDGHQPLHGKHPNALHHPHGIPPPYPHGTRPNAQLHHGQPHSGQKPLPPGSHPPPVGYSSKIPPLNPSKPPHNMNMPKPNVIGSTANKNSMAAHPPPVKKPYHEGYGTKEEMLSRRSNPNPNQQPRPRPSEKPELRHHQQPVQGGQLPNSAHPPPHGGADHSRSWTEHASAFGAGADGSSSRNEKPNPSAVPKNVMSADYYQRHRADNAPDKRIASGPGQIANNLGSSAVGNVVDRNDNVSIVKVDNMEDQFNQIVSKVNANNSYYPAINSGSGNIDSNVPSFKNKQGLHATSSSVAELAGFVKNEEDQLQISPPLNAMPDNKNKRRHTEGLMDIRNPTSSKRPRSDAHSSLGSGFSSISDEMTVESKKSLNSKSSPPHGVPRESRRTNSAFQKGMLPEAITTPFGNDSKSDISKLSLPSLSMELQPPELIEPFGENQGPGGKSQSLSRGSIFSPKLSDTPSISSIKQEVVTGSAKSSSSASLKPSNNSSYFSSNSSVSINSNSGHNGAQGIVSVPGPTFFNDAAITGVGVLPDPAASLVSRTLSNETSSSEHHKKSKKSKKEKHKHKEKHKDREEKKHKKHRDKDKDKDKEREKHKSRDKRRSVDAVESLEVNPAACKLKISIGPEKHVKEKESKSKHSSSTKRVAEEYVEESRGKPASASQKPTQSLKVKIVNKERVRSLDEEPPQTKSKSSSRLEQQNQHSQGQSTPCCPGFGPCTNPNCNQSQGPIKVKIPKEKITGASAARPKESKETKKSKKDKEPKVKDKVSVSTNSVVTSKSSAGRLSNTTSNHGHKNGVEKVTRKRESSSNL